MSLAVVQARVAQKMREVPIGCVIVRDGQVIGTGYNMTNHTRNATRHAELEAIDRILADHEGDVAKAGFNRCQLYVTIEPCIMCAGALSLLGFQQVFYGAGNDKFGGCGSIMQVHEHGCGCCSGREDGAPHGLRFEAHGGLFADQAIHLLQQFYVSGNPQAPKPHRTVLEVPPWEREDVGQDGATHAQPPSQPQPPSQQPPLQQQLDARLTAAVNRNSCRRISRCKSAA